MHLIRWWWHENGVFQSGAPDPHRARSQFPRPPMLPPDAGEQHPMHLSKEPDRHWETITNTPEAMFHREDVVLDLSGVIRFVRRRCLTRLETKKLADICLRALDARTQHGLEPQVGSDEQVRIRDQPSDATETMHGPRRFVQQCDYLLR